MKNAIIYIDYENIHETLLHKDTNVLRIGFFEKLKKWCDDKEIRILDIIAYCNFDLKELNESYHQTKLQEYGIQTIHTSNKGKNYADLKITTDLLETMYNNSKVDGFILVSNDKDMTPLISQVKKYKDFIYLVTAGSNYDTSVVNFPDGHISVKKIEEIACDELWIDKMDDVVFNSLKSYLENKIKDSNIRNKDTGLEYYVNNSFSYFKIMKYEFVNILKRLFDTKRIFLYKYEYNKKKYNAIMEESLKELCLSKSLFEESSIVDNFDFDAYLKEVYSEYKKKS